MATLTTPPFWPLREEPPLDATATIVFAVEKIEDHFERLEFLKLWLHGQWGEMRSQWPEAFNERNQQ
jgi:hypothetical protein